MAHKQLIDPQAWDAIVTELCGSTAIAQRFVSDYVRAWPVRYDRFCAALAAADAEEAYVSLLSIRTASQMVGAVRLARRAAKLEPPARAGRFAECAAGLGRLHSTGEKTMRALIQATAVP